MMNFREAMFDQNLLCEKFGLVKEREYKKEGKLVYILPSPAQLFVTFGMFERMVQISTTSNDAVDITYIKEGIDELHVDLSKEYPTLVCHAENKDSKTIIELVNSPVPKISIITLMK